MSAAPATVAADIARALAAHGVVADAVEPLSGGAMNPTWRVRHGRRRLVLRRTPAPAPGGRARTPAQVAWEHALLAHLHGAGLPVPVPLPARDGRTYLAEAAGGGWTLFPWLRGTPVHWSSPRPPSPARCDAAVDALVGLHAAARRFPLAGQRPGMGGMMELPRWVGEAHAGIGDLGRRLRQARRAPPGASAGRRDLGRQLDAFAICLDALARAAADLARERVEAIPLHGDFAPSNLGYVGARVAAIYDFDDAYRDARALDVAQLIQTAASTGRDRFDAATAIRILRRYHRQAPLSAVELRHLPTAIVAKLMLYAVPALAQQVLEPARDHGWIFAAILPLCLRHLAARDEWERIVAAAS